MTYQFLSVEWFILSFIWMLCGLRIGAAYEKYWWLRNFDKEYCQRHKVWKTVIGQLAIVAFCYSPQLLIFFGVWKR